MDSFQTIGTILIGASLKSHLSDYFGSFLPQLFVAFRWRRDHDVIVSLAPEEPPLWNFHIILFFKTVR